MKLQNISVFIVIASVNASVLVAPISTQAAEPSKASTGFSPKPTADPLARNSPEYLFKRQVDLGLCGYYNGVPNSCPVGYMCATNAVDNAAGCCVSSELAYCTLPTTCLNYDVLTDCGAGCATNGFIRKCTDPSNPWCYAKIWDYPIQATEMGCGTIMDLWFTISPNPQFLSASSIANIVSRPPASTTPTSPSSSAAANGGNGNNDNNVNNGNGNSQSQNNGNTYQGPVTINNGDEGHNGGMATRQMLQQGWMLIFGLHTAFVLLQWATTFS